MQFFIFFVLLPIVSICIPHNLIAQKLWTLEQCITHALENNIQIKQAELNRKLAESNLFQSIFQMMSPTLNADMSTAMNFGRFIDPTTNQFVNQQQTTYSTGLTARLTLFSGLSQWYGIQQNKMNLEASKSDMENTKNNVILTITRAFLQILLSKEEMNAAAAQLQLSQMQLNQAETLYQSGAVPLGNKLDAEAQLVRDSMNFIMARNMADLARLQLAIMLQLDPHEKFDVITPSVIPDNQPDFLQETAEQIFQTALSNQPSIKSAFFRERSARYRLGVARGLQFPTLTLFSNIRTNYSSGFEDYSFRTLPNEFDTLGYVGGQPITTPKRELISTPIPFTDQLTENLAKIVGISFNVPLLNGWQARNAIKTARLNLANAHLQLQQTENQLRQEVFTAFAEAHNAYQNYQAAQKNYEAFKKSLEYNEERHKAGTLNSLQYNTARTAFANAEIQLIRAKYDYVFKHKVLDFYKGNPIRLD